ncbi:hypothetical protein [Mucilaginibacter glaciei]|uniref:Uncharacterized protein n=1 Tax=Mucilaginibacter glaciei TaxID=2772109 RepID=A0A926P0N5_9SPHI|nr:hypothetical protein [Mucilaginibacter glaciei]MBD1395503.1 hypothetical protein [Mucilaginibacter glaciei]
MKKFTTSAQKTLSLSKEVILQRLETEMSRDSKLIFKETNKENIKEAKLIDGSVLVIASFDKEDGKTLAMIDFKDVPEEFDRQKIQKHLRNRLDKIFLL